jgi:Aldolase/RraA
MRIAALLRSRLCVAIQLPFRLQGIIINGCIRDSADIAKMPLGVKALATYPLKSSKRDPGLQNVPVSFGGVIFQPGASQRKANVIAVLRSELVSSRVLLQPQTWLFCVKQATGCMRTAMASWSQPRS